MNFNKLSLLLLLSCISFSLKAMDESQVPSDLPLTSSLLNAVPLTPEQHKQLQDEIDKRKTPKSLKDILKGRSEKAEKLFKKSLFEYSLNNRSKEAKKIYAESSIPMPDAMLEDPIFKEVIVAIYDNYKIDKFKESSEKRSEAINAQNMKEEQARLAKEEVAKKVSSSWWPWSK